MSKVSEMSMGITTRHYTYNQQKATDIVTNTSNEHRLALLYFFMERNSLLRRVNMAYDADKKQVQKIRSQFNRFMNEWLGLNYLVEEVVGQPK